MAEAVILPEVRWARSQALDLSIFKVAYLLSVWVAIRVRSVAQRERVTYCPVLATDRVAYFHHSLMCIDGYDTSVCSYDIGVGCYGVRFQGQLGLGSEWLVIARRKHIRRTLKT